MSGFDPTLHPRDDAGRFSSGLQDSLEAQLRGKGHAAEKARELAIEILTERGHMDASGRLTAEGQRREDMGRRARRVDRHARQSGHNPRNIGYQGGRTYVK